MGDLALKLHTGRSRNDQVATDLRLYLIAKIGALETELDRLLRILADLAQRNLGVVLPGYTHLQRAQPVLFSHYLLAYGSMFLRDRDRLREILARTRVCPLGSGALSGTVYRVDREALARELGFVTALRQQPGCRLGPGFRPRFSFLRQHAHDSSEPAIGRSDSLLFGRIWIPADARLGLVRQQSHAAKEKPGCSRAASRARPDAWWGTWSLS